MFTLMPLLATVVLVSLLSVQSYAQIDGKIELDNNLSPNDIARPTASRSFDKFARITSPPPEIVQHMPGSPLVLACEIVGNPTPVTGWTKNGVPITDLEQSINEIYSQNFKTFGRIMTKLVVNSPMNGDVYTCIASNGLMEKEASTTVLVDDDQTDLVSKIIPTKPVITLSYVEIFQYKGNALTIPCRVYSPTKSQIYWFDKNGNVIYGHRRMRVQPSGDLVINPILYSDLGLYNCTAKNSFGKDVAETYVFPMVIKK